MNQKSNERHLEREGEGFSEEKRAETGKNWPEKESTLLSQDGFQVGLILWNPSGQVHSCCKPRRANSRKEGPVKGETCSIKASNEKLCTASPKGKTTFHES